MVIRLISIPLLFRKSLLRVGNGRSAELVLGPTSGGLLGISQVRSEVIQKRKAILEQYSNQNHQQI
jgi:hypothetical protein